MCSKAASCGRAASRRHESLHSGYIEVRDQRYRWGSAPGAGPGRWPGHHQGSQPWLQMQIPGVGLLQSRSRTERRRDGERVSHVPGNTRHMHTNDGHLIASAILRGFQLVNV